ncbi:MAG: apolipoprotein N-acyltransferase [Vulcanimicrobiota bacterium]
MQAWLLAALAGLLGFLATPPYDQFYLGWVEFVPLLWACREASPRLAFLLGWLSGTLINLGAFYWVYELMVTHSGIPPLGAVGLTLFLSAQQGLRLAIWMGLARALEERAPRWLLYAVVYTACEFLYPTIFPLHLSNSQHNCLWTSQAMDLAGPAGLSFLMIVFQAGLWSLLEKRKANLDTAVGLGVLVATLVYGGVRVHQVEAVMNAAPVLRMAMVENNVGLVETSQDVMGGMQLLQTLAGRATADLIVFPETSVKTPPPLHWVRGRNDPVLEPVLHYPLGLAALAQSGPYAPQLGYQTPLLFGTVAIDEEHEGPIPGRPALYNAAFLVDAQGQVLGTALKNKLLLFGEFIPAARYFPWIYTSILDRASCLVPGTEPGVLPFDGHRIGVSICYEDILPNFNYRLGRGQPELLVNLTNDAWFGKTAEPAAHLALAKARAIELRLYMARSTTTGISAFIDPLGRVMAQTTTDEPESLEQDLAWMPGGTLFSVIGPGFAWLCVVVCLVWMVQARRARSLNPTDTRSSRSDRRAAAE